MRINSEGKNQIFFKKYMNKKKSNWRNEKRNGYKKTTQKISRMMRIIKCIGRGRW